MVTVQVLDDSGAVQDTFEMPFLEIADFEAQLPEGWKVEVM